MSSSSPKYCLDANVLIRAWNEYYSPRFCTEYWDVLNTLGKQDKIFVPKLVYEEIVRTEDDLSAWLKSSYLPVREITQAVTGCLQEIFAKNPLHKFLVDNTKQRSLADPWVIAHAMSENCCVVTRENKETSTTKRIKIPNVCDNMAVKWVNDFGLIEELGIRFSCKLGI